MQVEIKVKKLRDHALLPQPQSERAAGADLYICWEEVAQKMIWPGERILVPTGLAVEVPQGYEGQVRPRSGLALNKGLTVLNAPGTIDPDYRGEIGIVLINHGEDAIALKNGDRIAQLVIAPIVRATFIQADTLEETARGTRGFGSTG